MYNNKSQKWFHILYANSINKLCYQKLSKVSTIFVWYETWRWEYNELYKIIILLAEYYFIEKNFNALLLFVKNISRSKILELILHFQRDFSVEKYTYTHIFIKIKFFKINKFPCKI